MGPMAPFRQLAPNADSLGSRFCRTVFVVAFYILATFYHVFDEKSNVFLAKILDFFTDLFVDISQECIFPFGAIDKRPTLCFNTTIHIAKDIDGKLA